MAIRLLGRIATPENFRECFCNPEFVAIQNFGGVLIIATP